MAAITPTTVYRESVGSMTLLIANLTVGSNSDTWTIDKNDPVVSFWAQSAAGVAYNEPDVTWTPSTGVFLFTSGTVVGTAFNLFVLVRT